MTISELKSIIQEQLPKVKVKSISTFDGAIPKTSSELFIGAPGRGYVGKGELIGNEEFVWRFAQEGNDWYFYSEMIVDS